ncbi:MAG: hypothetical protein MUP85_03395 [Candidatus Lokiarchaeota archaeon]|jgi:hypothetical protein|nr:hypothetical protein [Candidatus Lokiarchaeota archaeon]
MMVTENQFYISLFDDYVNNSTDPEKKIMWKLNSIIRLMNMTDNYESDFCENALRMIMVLFNEVEFESWELDNGKPMDIPENDKNLFNQILFDEIC